MEYNGPEGIMVCKSKQDVVEELEKRISKDGMAYIPENVYESINYQPPPPTTIRQSSVIPPLS